MSDDKVEIPGPPDSGTDVKAAPPAYALYAPQHVGIASLIGGPAAGAFILSSNYTKLGRSQAAVTALTLGILAVVGLALLGLALPEDLRLTGIGVGLAVGMFYLAKSLQGPAFEAHVAAGGARASAWRAAGVGLIALAVIVGSWFLLAFIAAPRLGERVTFGPDEEIYYSEGATEADARKLGQALQDLGFFTGSGGKTVAVQRFSDGFAVSFVVQSGAWNDEEIVAAFRQVGATISDSAFDGAAVQIRLCDEAVRTKKEILILRRELRLPGS